jgi:hypothetical protein
MMASSIDYITRKGLQNFSVEHTGSCHFAAFQHAVSGSQQQCTMHGTCWPHTLPSMVDEPPAKGRSCRDELAHMEERNVWFFTVAQPHWLCRHPCAG